MKNVSAAVPTTAADLMKLLAEAMERCANSGRTTLMPAATSRSWLANLNAAINGPGPSKDDGGDICAKAGNVVKYWGKQFPISKTDHPFLSPRVG
jgi:hypothetical protein